MVAIGSKFIFNHMVTSHVLTNITFRHKIILTIMTMFYTATLSSHTVIQDMKTHIPSTHNEVEYHLLTLYTYLYLYIAILMTTMARIYTNSPWMDDEDSTFSETNNYEHNQEQIYRSSQWMASVNYKLSISMVILTISSHMLADQPSLHM